MEETSPENMLDPHSFVDEFIKPFKEQIVPSSVFIAQRLFIA